MSTLKKTQGTPTPSTTGRTPRNSACPENPALGGATILPFKDAAEVADLLAPLARELTVLSVNGKQAHWHVRGTNFVSVHELLDRIIDHARNWSDTVAERLIALGIPFDATITGIAKNTKLPAFPTGFLDTDTVIEHYVAALDTVITMARKTLTLLGDLDPVSQDVVIQALADLEKDRWFLSYSHSTPSH